MKLDNDTLRDLVDERLPRSQVRAIQSSYKDPERFEEASARYPRFYAQLTRLYRDHVRELEEAHQPYPRDVWDRAIRKAETLSISVPASQPNGTRSGPR